MGILLLRKVSLHEYVIFEHTSVEQPENVMFLTTVFAG